ncbi:hypothetical protein ACROYT_G027450 [Oculina patagonica]
MEDVILNADEDDSNTKAREECPKSFHLFNCDKTYNLDAVEKLLLDIKDNIRRKLSFDIQLSISKNYFGLSKMSELCETTIPKLQMDFAIFVVHAHESRLSINEDNAGISGICYAKIYRALLKATDGNVLIVIGGDDNYKSKDEEESSVISRWALRKISSQFQKEFLDGRKSFVFSWDKQHRPIHEEALLHFLNPNKKGQKFEYQPKERPRGQESKTENREKNKEEDDGDQYQEREVEDYADRRAKNYSSIERNRKKPKMPVIPERGAESTQDDSLHFVFLPDRKDGQEEEFEVVDIAEIHNTEVEPETTNTGVETLLMKTRLRYGQISYSKDDQVVWNEQWTPPDELLADISNRFKNVAVADFEIYCLQGAGAIRVKITETANSSVIYAIYEIVYNMITWIIDNAWLYIRQAIGSEAELKEEKKIDDSEEGFEKV